ncbi:MAG: TAXI family TRAP transporter solute-binding subunit [Lautropia sp.]
MMKRSLTFVTALAAALLLAAPGGARAEQFVRIGSGLAGSYPVFGAKLAELFNQHVPGVKASTFAGPTGQSLVKLQRGEAEAVLSYTFESYAAMRGENALKVPAPDLRHLMTTYGATHVALARKGVEISTLADLAKKPYRVWLGPKTSVFWPMNLAALEAHGVTPDAIVKAGGVISSAGYGTLMQAFMDGQVDVAFMSGPTPYSLMMELDRGTGFQLLPFSEAALAKYNEILPGTARTTIPAGTYKNVPTAMQVPYVVNHIVVSAKLPEPIVYQMAKTLVEQHKTLHGLFAGAAEIDPANATKNNKLPLHPGAERYYREAGLLK